MPLVSERSMDSRRGGLSQRHQKSRYAGAFTMDEGQAEVMQDFARKDDNSDKTWTRRIVESYLSKYKWYFPMKDKPNGPSLNDAYAFYEHVTLPRFFSSKEDVDHVQRRAEPGESEEETRLYSPWFTKANSFNEWGMGIDSYFSSLKMVSAMMFVAGILNIYVLQFYASSDYDPEKDDSLSVLLKGSAICTSFEWVACPTCSQSDFDGSENSEERYGVAEDGTILVKRNACSNDLMAPGMVNYATFFLLGACLILMSMYLRAREIRSDEDKLTASDYSIVVRNPPPTAFEPDLWRDFFDKFAEKQVTCVTVALNNEKMLRKLIARRIHRNNLRLMLPSGTNMDDEDLVQTKIAELERERAGERKGILFHIINMCILPWLRIFGMFLPPQSLFDRVVKLTKEVKELQKEEYTVSTVFVTFETENGQRTALDALSVGEIDILTNNTSRNPENAFQGKVLRVQEPTEPNAVRWLDLSSSFVERIFWRVVNLGITIGVVSAAGTAVAAARSSVGTSLSGPLVTLFNSTIPYIVKILMMFERHLNEGQYQSSLYLKIVLFRWINTAVLTKVITPFTGNVTDGAQDVLPTLVAILYSELLITPTLKLLDIFGNLKKHILAPRTRTQEEMNSYFTGTFYNLGERYTDFSKVLFVVFFYAALFPAGFFFGSLILIVQHYTDKYCLMRIWGNMPAIGSELAQFSRRYIFNGALLAFVLVSAYAWVQFPYDNICEPETTDGNNYIGTYTNVKLLNGETLDRVFVQQNTNVVYCAEMDWRESDIFFFPPTSRLEPSSKTWLSSEQAQLSDIFGWTGFGITVLFYLVFFGTTTVRIFMSLFRKTYTPEGKNQMVDYSSNLEIFAYVPQIKTGAFAFPLIACDVDDIYQNLIGWTDEARGYDWYNLIFDVPYPNMKRTKVIEGNTRGKASIKEHSEYRENSEREKNVRIDSRGIEVTERDRPIFSIMKHYPPAWLTKVLKKEPTIKEDDEEDEEA